VVITDAPVTSGPWPARLRFIVPATIVFVGSMLLDLRTLRPGLGFWDTGEFQALGPVLGIAHPTGYPSYTLLLWLASVVLQPFGDPAFRANLLSAILVSGAAALVAVAVVQVTRRAAIGLVAGALLAVAPIAWGNAVRADPHGFHLFLSALLLVLLVGWGIRERSAGPHAGWWLVAAAVCFGVSIGNHALTLLLAPGIALFVLSVSPRILWRQWRFVLLCLAVLVVTTLLVYAYLPIRSAMGPPLDYAHPADWVRTDPSGHVTGGFRYLVFGQQFTSTFHALPTLGEATRTVWGVLETNLGLAAWVSVVGLLVGIWRRRRLMLLTIPWFVLPIWFLLGYENADIDRYYLVPIMVAVLWAGIGLDWLWDLALERWSRIDPAWSPKTNVGSTAVTVGVAVLLLLPVLWAVPTRYGAVDESGDTAAREWLDATLAALEPDPVVMSWWSYSTPLWYGRWVEGARPDMTIIDDRTMLDEGLGDMGDLIDGYLDSRPVYLIRLDDDLPEFRERFRLEAVPDIPHGRVWRVVGRLDDAQG
jgi:hypothetical protein